MNNSNKNELGTGLVRNMHTLLKFPEHPTEILPMELELRTLSLSSKLDVFIQKRV